MLQLGPPEWTQKQNRVEPKMCWFDTGFGRLNKKKKKLTLKIGPSR